MSAPMVLVYILRLIAIGFSTLFLLVSIFALRTSNRDEFLSFSYLFSVTVIIILGLTHILGGC